MISPRNALAALVSIAIALTGCGAAGPAGTTPKAAEHPELAALRREAEAHPEDAGHVKAWALAELFHPAGATANATRAVDRARRLAPDDATVLFASGVERALHGDGAAAEKFFLASLEHNPSTLSRFDALRNEVAVHALAAEMDARRTRAPGATEKTLVGLEPKADALGQPAAHALRVLVLENALRRGDPKLAEAVRGRAGCPVAWRVAGPFGDRALLGFDERFAPETDAALQDRYVGASSRGDAETRAVTARTCDLNLGEPSAAEGGSFYAETRVTARAAGPHELRIETPNAVKVWVDGALAFTADARRTPSARTAIVRVQLAAGEHTVRAKVTTRHPNPVLSLSVAPATWNADAPELLGKEPFDAASEPGLDGWLRAAALLARGAVVWARHLAPEGKSATTGAASKLLLAQATAQDPSWPEDARRDRIRALLRGALEGDPGLWFAAVTLARLEGEDGRVAELLRRLEQAHARWPHRADISLELSAALAWRGFDAQADAVLETARRHAPDDCAVLERLRARAQKKRNFADQVAAAKELGRCDARSPATLEVLFHARRWDDVAREIARLETLTDAGAMAGVWTARLRLALGRGDNAGAEAALAGLLRAAEEDPRVAVSAVDWKLATEGKAAAKIELQARSRALRRQSPELHRIDDALFGQHPLARHRLDGAAVIRDFVRSKRTYDQPKIMVLDYTIMAVEPDGSTIELTHNIWRAQSEEGVDALGEYSVPEGAELYRLRTHKADGRILEPDLIAGKNTISLPDLRTGDFVEAEYVRYGEPNRIFPGGVLTWRFYFQTMEEAFDRSELTVILPKGTEAVVNTKGRAPKLVRRSSGDNEVLHWRADRSMPMVAEPGSVPPRELLASVQVSARVSWSAQLDAMRDLFADLDTFDPEHAMLVDTILSTVPSDASDMDRARALHAWVLDNVQHENEFYGSAPAMVRARAGHRTRVFHYLAELADLDSALVLAKSLASDPSPAAAPDLNDGMSVFARVRDGERDAYLALDNRAVPFGYIPALTRGAEAYALEANAAPFAMPSTPGADAVRVDAALTVSANGSATVEVTEAHTGATAIQWRNGLEEVPPAVLEQRFGEGYAARLLPGATLTSLAIDGAAERDTPLVLRYTFRTAELGRAEGPRRLVTLPFLRNLTASYASVATRQYPALVVYGQDAVVHLRLAAKGGSVREAAAAAQHKAKADASFVLSASPRAGALEVETRTHVGVQRIAPEDYAEFQAFCQAVDQLEGREYVLEF